MLKLTWAQAPAWRAHRHHLVKRARTGSMLEVASRLCGLHAQVMSCAELALWARIENFNREDVRRALWDDRTLVKTWAMRGTLHLLPAAELSLWRAALRLSPRYMKEARWRTSFGIGLDDLNRITEAIGAVLDGRVMTREELVREVEKLSGSATYAAKLAESSWGTILKPAAFSGRLCFGPSLGQRVRFTRPDTWLAEAGHSLLPEIDPQVSVTTITRHFLSAYGPASFHDLARWWGGGGVSVARRWIASLGDEATPVDLEGTPAWMLKTHAREAAKMTPARTVRLLPGFDQYVVGSSHHASQLLPGDYRSRIYRPQGWISPVLLVDGRMHGTWRHEIKGNRVEVAIDPFVKPPVWVRRAAGQEAERLAAFFGCTLDLSWKV
jgi:uncharacterized protein YcaQ